MKQLQVLQSVMMPLSSLRANVGQVPGLPANPKSIDKVQLARLKKSLRDNPEMLALRELLIYQYDGENIVIGGNQRIQALQSMSIKEVPCKIIPPKTTAAQLRAYLIKDNIEFGEWVDEMLGADWNMEELDSFGMDDVERFAKEVDEQTDEAPATTSEKPKVSDVLKKENCVAMCIGQRNYLVSSEEAERFRQRADAYKQENGTYAGFLTKLFKSL